MPPSVPDSKRELLKFGHLQKAKFWDCFQIKKWHSNLDFFLLSLLPFSFPFLASVFSLTGHLLGFWNCRLRWKEVQVCSGTKFSFEFFGSTFHVFFFLFLMPPWLIHAHSGLKRKDKRSWLVCGLLCGRSQVWFPVVTSIPSFNFFPFHVALSSLKYL